MGTKKSYTILVKDECPHCQGTIALNVISPDKVIADKKFIDSVDSLSYQKMIESSPDSGVRMPEHRQCPRCKKIIFFLNIANIQITDINIKESLAKK